MGKDGIGEMKVQAGRYEGNERTREKGVKENPLSLKQRTREDLSLPALEEEMGQVEFQM